MGKRVLKVIKWALINGAVGFSLFAWNHYGHEGAGNVFAFSAWFLFIASLMIHAMPKEQRVDPTRSVPAWLNWVVGVVIILYAVYYGHFFYGVLFLVHEISFAGYTDATEKYIKENKKEPTQ